MPPPIVPSPAPIQATTFDLVGQIVDQSRLDPDKVAIRHGERVISYRELDEKSDRLGCELIARGNHAGDFTGIGLPRSPELVIAILATLKAGAAYVPIDPSYPEERISHMLASARLGRVITNTESAIKFSGTEVILATSDGVAGYQPVEQFPTRNSPDDFIYAIFTSGSTGLPKAATVFHKGFRNLVDWYATELRMTRDDVNLVISSPSFDLTQKNFFAPLATGGTLILDHGDHYDIHRITATIRDQQVTILNCTPSAFYPLVDAASGNGYRDLTSLRHVVLGGEAISIPRLRCWLEHPDCHADILNSYGPTECADVCAYYRLNRHNLDSHSFVPTGVDVPNTRVTVRDENLRELPGGEIGELCVEGIGVGGGYLHDPERTAERFVNGIYRTGDLGRRLADGVIEFRGRTDHQVKVNGFRIELGEIEIHISSHTEVKESIVTAEEGRLIAHIQGTVNEAALREYLSSRLPSYMIPVEFRFRDEFPLTPNGKIDRKALVGPPVPAPASASANQSLEGKILALWSELIGRQINDPEANFFDLGGTSIHLAVVHVRLRELTGMDINITDLFAHPNARSLAAHLSPSTAPTITSASQNRARLQQAGFSRFQRPKQS